MKPELDDDSGTYDVRGIRLTEEEIDYIAKKAAKHALVQVYAEVGQSVLKRLAWLLGVALLALLIYLAGKNALPTPLTPPHA
jgi:hypothetical protein